MSAISLLIEKLNNYPELEYVQDVAYISVTPINGFKVWLSENEATFTVGFAGWHEEFKDVQEAIDCFGFGLSDKCRLKVYKRGTLEYKWIVQALHEDKWYDESETGLLFFPFWRKKQVLILQNVVIKNQQTVQE